MKSNSEKFRAVLQCICFPVPCGTLSAHIQYTGIDSAVTTSTLETACMVALHCSSQPSHPQCLVFTAHTFRAGRRGNRQQMLSLDVACCLWEGREVVVISFFCIESVHNPHTSRGREGAEQSTTINTTIHVLNQKSFKKDLQKALWCPLVA